MSQLLCAFHTSKFFFNIHIVYYISIYITSTHLPVIPPLLFLCIFLEACYLHLSPYPTESKQIPLLAVNAVREDFLKATSNLYHLTHVAASLFWLLTDYPELLWEMWISESLWNKYLWRTNLNCTCSLINVTWS